MNKKQLYAGIYRGWKMVLDVIFPARCPYCDKVVPFLSQICPECRNSFVHVKEPRCLRCGKPIGETEIEFCMDCRRKKHYFSQGRGLYEYSSAAASLYRFKYAGRREYAEFYSDEMVKHLGDTIRQWNAQVLVPVPIHRSRKHRRGYNQAEVLATALGRKLDIPVDAGLLKRVKKTVPQKFLDEQERQNNLKKAFKIGHNDVKWKTAIIVDDIYTTGSTIDACASVLLKTGIEKVYYVSVAIGTDQSKQEQELITGTKGGYHERT